MKKELGIILNGFLSLLLVLGNAPLTYAQEVVAAGPIVVVPFSHTINTIQTIETVHKEILNQDRGNRDDEIAIRELIDENDLLTQALCERQETILNLRRQIYGVAAPESALAGGCGSTLKWLMRINRTMMGYSNDIVARDQKRIAQQSAPEAQYNADSQEVMALVKQVEAIKARNTQPAMTDPKEPEMDKVDQALIKASITQADPSVAPTVADPAPAPGTNAALKTMEANLNAKLDALAVKTKKVEDNLQELKGTLDHPVTAPTPAVVVVRSQPTPRVQIQDDQALKTAEADLNAKLAALETKTKLIEEKGTTLQNLKSQVMDINTQLKEANTHYEQVINIYSNAVKSLKSQWAAERDQQSQSNTNQANHMAALKSQVDHLTAQSQSDAKTIEQLRSQDQSVAFKAKIAELTKSFQGSVDEMNRREQIWKDKGNLLSELKNKLTADDAKLAQIDGIVSDKDKAIAQLKTELAQVKSDLISTRKELADTKDKLDQSYKDLAKAQETVKAQEETIKIQKQELDSNKNMSDNDTAKLKGQLEESAGDLAKAQAMVKMQEETIRQLKQSLSDNTDGLTADLAKAKVTIKNQQDRAVQQDQAMSNFRTSIDQLKDAMSQTDQSLAKKENLFTRIAQDVSQLKSQLSQQSDLLSGKDMVIKKLRKRLDEVQEQSDANANSTQETTALMASLKEQVHALKNDFTNKESDLGKFEDTIVSLRSQINQLQAQSSDQNSQISNKDNRIAELESKLKTTMASAERAAQSSTEEIQQKSGAIDQLNQKLADLAAQLKQKQELEAENQALAEQLGLGRNWAGKEKDLIKLLYEKLQVKDQEYASYQKKADQLDEKIKTVAALRQRASTADVDLQNQQQQIKALKDELKVKSMEAVSMLDVQKKADQLDEKIKALTALREKADAANADLQDQQKQIQSLKDELQTKTMESARMSAMLDVYQGKLKTSNDNYEAKLQEILDAKKHQAELENTIAQFNDTTSMKDQQVQKGKEYFAELERRYSDKEQEVKAKDLSLSMLQNLVDQNAKDYQSKMDELKGVLDKQKEEIVSLNTQLAAAQSQPKTKDNGDQTSDLVRLKMDLKTTQDSLSKINDQFQYKDKEIERLKERSLAKENELKKMLNDATNGNKDEIAALIKKLKTADKQMKILAQADTVFQLKEELQSSHEQILAMKDKLRQKQEEMEALEKKNKTMAKVSEPDESEVASLHAQLNALRVKLDENHQKTQATEEELEQSKQRVIEMQAAIQSSDKNSGEVVSLRNTLADAQKKVRDTASRLQTKDEEIKGLKADFSDKADAYKKDLADLNDQIKVQANEITRLTARIQEKPAVVDGDSTKQLNEKQMALNQLQSQLEAKTKVFLKQQKQIEEAQKQLKQTRQDNDDLKTKLKVFESTPGIGNEGYLIRDGKSTAIMVDNLNKKVEGLQQELVAAKTSRQEIQNKYDVMFGELNEARSMMQACMAKVNKKPTMDYHPGSVNMLIK